MTTLFVATAGGHLAQLDGLADRLPTDGDAVWVTSAGEQSRSLLRGREVEFVAEVGSRDVRGVLRCLPVAHRLLRTRKPSRAVSTGSGIALGFLPYLAARGVECHYIESATRVRGLSLTGKVLRWIPNVHVYTQYPQRAGRRWHYGGSQFDSFEPVAASWEPHRPFRVVVTVGTSTLGFRRLIESLIPLLGVDGELPGLLGVPVEVLWQTGATEVADLPIAVRPFVPADELQAAIRRCDVVIAHAGTGSALAAFQAGRLPLLVPRARRYGEAADDHQDELATELVRRGLALRTGPDRISTAEVLAAAATRVRSRSAPAPFRLTNRSAP